MLTGLVVLAVLAPPPSSGAAGARGSVQIVQALPGQTVDVSLDGKPLESRVREGAIVGPVKLAAGRHVVMFSENSGGQPVRTTVTVRAGSNTDVVLHRPAAVSGAPVVHSYSTPRKAVGPGKARVLVAHTATVAPADVRVDGRTVFTNIANGEYAQADIPAGKHRVALLPTGQTSEPILGPLEVELAARTVTMVYAVGSPRNGSMKVIAHVVHIAADGTVVPDRITTGSAGFAALFPVIPFGG
ncbi:MAG: DUF4397 domain-containing protein [Nocardioidaceae bacterium]